MSSQDTEQIHQALRDQILQEPIILYMKGTPEAPLCGFSAKTVEILKHYDVPFAYVNVIAYPAARSGLPQISHWPTFPQLFVQGELVGGCDLIVELHEAQQLEPILAPLRDETPSDKD